MSDDAAMGWLCVVVVLSPILILIPAVLWMGLRMALRNRGGAYRIERRRCASCGYDLRATPERCPECGTPASTEVGP